MEKHCHLLVIFTSHSVGLWSRLTPLCSGICPISLRELYLQLINLFFFFLLQFYAVYAFQARSDQELTLQELQHVRILKFNDLGGNKDWWLAEVDGQKGYVPSNYLGKMSYA